MNGRVGLGERVAALYDIHGNLPALEAVLRDVRSAGATHLVVGGDVVPGPMPRECLECLLTADLPATFISGNCEREMLELAAGGTPRLPPQVIDRLRWSGEELGARHRALVAGWPATAQTSIAGVGEVLFCHATPRNDSDIFTPRTSETVLAPLFTNLGADVVVCGHTHIQFERMVADVRVINAGSVGMSFCGPGAFWLLFDGAPIRRRTAYDVDVAADRIRATHFPGSDVFANESVRNPPSEEAMLELLAKVEMT